MHILNSTEVQEKYRKFEHRYFYELSPEAAGVIFDFFIVFSRFEFALKRAGYLKVDKSGRPIADANWTSFAKTVHNEFNKSVSKEFQEACDYYTSYPPKKQDVREGTITWKPNIQGGKTEFEWILGSVKTVRNNLFHGGKFPYDQVRDTALLYYGLVILYECLNYDEQVKQEFNSV